MCQLTYTSSWLHLRSQGARRDSYGAAAEMIFLVQEMLAVLPGYGVWMY